MDWFACSCAAHPPMPSHAKSSHAIPGQSFLQCSSADKNYAVQFTYATYRVVPTFVGAVTATFDSRLDMSMENCTLQFTSHLYYTISAYFSRAYVMKDFKPGDTSSDNSAGAGARVLKLHYNVVLNRPCIRLPLSRHSSQHCVISVDEMRITNRLDTVSSEHPVCPSSQDCSSGSIYPVLRPSVSITSMRNVPCTICICKSMWTWMWIWRWICNVSVHASIDLNVHVHSHIHRITAYAPPQTTPTPPHTHTRARARTHTPQCFAGVHGLHIQ